MNKPKKVVVAGQDFEIVWDDEAADEESNFGSTSDAFRRIRIGAATPQTKLRETLLHEVLHAIQHTHLIVKNRLPEQTVKLLSTVLYDTLRRNPEVAEAILGLDE